MSSMSCTERPAQIKEFCNEEKLGQQNTYMVYNFLSISCVFLVLLIKNNAFRILRTIYFFQYLGLFAG